MKKALVLVLALFVAMALLVGCGTQAPQQQEGAEKIGLVVSTLNNPFFVTLRDGAQAKANELGYELVVLDSQNDAARELANVEDLIQRGVSVILINPTDSDAVGNAIMVANDGNIPVITLDRGANEGEVVSHIASDNAAGGKMAGEYILETLGENGKVVELEGIPGTSAARDRGKGFNDAVGEASGVEVVARQAADFDRTKGLNVMENIIQAQEEIDAVFAHNDEMALGAIEALAAAGRDNVMVVGFDATDDAVNAVNEGRMAATVAQQPDSIGAIGVENAAKVIKGESVEANIPVDLKLVTQ